MAIDETYYGKPTIASPDPFTTLPPPGSIEYDRYQVESKKAQAARYQDSMGSASSDPSTPLNRKRNEDSATISNKVEDAGLLSRAYNYLKSFFVGGSSESVQGEGGIFQSIKSFFGMTPELTPPGRSDHKLSQMHLEHLALAIKQMNKAIQEIQAVATEEITTSDLSHEAAAQHAFLKFLEKYERSKQNQKLDHTQEITFHFSLIQENQTKQREFTVALDDAKYYSSVSDNVGMAASATLVLTVVSQGVLYVGVAAGALTANPGLMLAAQLTSVAIMGLQGATKLLSAKYNNERIDNQGKIQTLQHESDTKRHLNKGLQDEIKHLQGQETNAISSMAHMLEEYNKVTQEILKNI